MNMLFSMSLAGSLVLLIYLVIEPAAKRYLPATWRYWLLKVTLLFYLLPYQYLKYKYKTIGRSLFPNWPPNPEIQTPNIAANANRMILVDSTGHIHFKNHTIILFILGIWGIFTLIYLLYHLIKYVDCIMNLQQIAKMPVTMPDTTNEQHKFGKPAKIKVSLFASQHIAAPFTVGIFFPRILLPASLIGKKEGRMVVSHELAHVKNHDNLIKVLCLLAILLHWYNPFVYLLYWKICKVSEQVCDAAVIQDMPENEIEQYKSLIIEFGQKGPYIDTFWASPFNGKYTMIKERMIVMNKTTNFSKKTRIVASLLTAVLLLALSPIPVLAYSPAPTCAYQDQQSNIDGYTLYAVFEQMDSQDIYDPFFECGIEHDVVVFSDGQPHILEGSGHQAERVFCSHDWKDCKIYNHSKHDDGSCTLYCHNAQMCTICQSIRNMTLYCEYKYTKCPH